MSVVEVTVEFLDLESEPEAELLLLPLPEPLAEPELVGVPVDEALLPPPLLDPELDLAVLVDADPSLDESVFDAVTDDAVDDGDALSDDAPVVSAQRASALLILYTTLRQDDGPHTSCAIVLPPYPCFPAHGPWPRAR